MSYFEVIRGLFASLDNSDANDDLTAYDLLANQFGHAALAALVATLAFLVQIVAVGQSPSPLLAGYSGSFAMAIALGKELLDLFRRPSIATLRDNALDLTFYACGAYAFGGVVGASLDGRYDGALVHLLAAMAAFVGLMALGLYARIYRR